MRRLIDIGDWGFTCRAQIFYKTSQKASTANHHVGHWFSFFTPLLPFIPTVNSPFDICRLGALVAARTQQDNTLARCGVVNAVAWTPVHPQLPHPIAYGLAVAEVTVFKPDH